jgi:hypothetical protein
MKAMEVILHDNMGNDGAIITSKASQEPDVCINGMFLNYACYFGIDKEKIKSMVDFIISQQMPDGAFNCELNRGGARHSSMHTTINALEGIREYILQGYGYRLEALLKIEMEAQQFLLQHKLFRSDRTGKIINPGMLRLRYPSRWWYDILRALEYFRNAGVSYDERMQEALNLIQEKRTCDGRWKVQAHHPGVVHFEMEPAGEASRWNTLRAMRVLEYYAACHPDRL